ncbi:RNA methyltransferase, TrmH family, group 3 [Marinithermus hydrothermalis DSM 14884]|uniref:RNA methyltransferase, TrmH family, group 3 n=2 Tax=Marinithermus TaxID=186191 RepID=F2NPM7_MARHT|nr:RNA methyltransferase, TrmH family, group 3 [Marinithermus hydrothermalis DSM 14884]
MLGGMRIYGRNPVLEALREGRVRRVWVARGVERWLVRQLEASGVELVFVPRIELDQMVRTTRHQGVVAEVEGVAFADEEAPLRRARERGEPPLLVLVDGVTDPRNFGAILRTAEALGAHGVVSEERRSAPLSPVAVKASAGAAHRIPVVRVKNLPRYIEWLKGLGVWVYGTAGQAEKTLAELDYARPLALVVGSEGEGMRRIVREHCDELVRIELRGETESLNVAVALGIALHWAVQHRG